MCVLSGYGVMKKKKGKEDSTIGYIRLHIIITMHYIGALNDMLQIIDGIKILQDLNLFDNVCKASPKSSGGAQSAYDYCVALYDKFVQYNSTTEPVWIQLIGEMLEIAFHQPGFAETYAEKLLLENNATYANQLAIYQKFSSHVKCSHMIFCTLPLPYFYL